MAKRKQSAIVDIKIRMREPLRAQIERAAARRGVSMNAEMVERLDRSFEVKGRNERLLPEVLDLAFGSAISGMLMLLGIAMKNVASRHALKHDAAPIGDGMDMPMARAEALKCARLLLDWAGGKPFQITDNRRSTLGERVAASLEDWAEGRSNWSGDDTIVEPIRQRLRSLQHEAKSP